ncbi:MAG: hypothetical protein AAF387_06140 [Pseudomonadota bacterium]
MSQRSRGSAPAFLSVPIRIFSNGFSRYLIAMVDKDYSLETSRQVFIVQDNLFRVWGKVYLNEETSNMVFGDFEAMPDFQYLAKRFQEYEQEISQAKNLANMTELNAWMVKLRPKLVDTEGTEIDLLTARVLTAETSGMLLFQGLKLDGEDEEHWPTGSGV